MRWEAKYTAALVGLYNLPFVQRVKAILEDTALVILVILCFKLVGIIMVWTGASPELYHKFTILKDFVFLVLYAVLSVHLLDKLELFALLARLYTWLKGKSNGSSAILAA